MLIGKKISASPNLFEETLFCITSLQVSGGGIAKFNRELLTFLNAHQTGNKKIKVLNLLDNDETLKGNPYPNIEILGFNKNRIKLASALFSELFNRPPKLLFFEHVNLAQLGLLQSFTFGIPYVVFLHGIEVMQVNPLKKITLKKANELWANSHFTQETARKRTGLNSNLCYLGMEEIKASFYSPKQIEVEDAFGRKDKLPSDYFLIVSRLDPRERHKGHDLILKAMKHNQGKGNLKPLVIVGEGKDKKRIRKLAIDLGVGTHVYFTNFVNELEKHFLIKNCRAFVMPSKHEGFGFVYLEAMQYEKPCIGSKSDASQEIIQDGISGFTIDIKDVEKLSFCLLELSNNDMLCKEFGRKARQRFLKDFSSSAFSQRLIERFKKTAVKM